jgi:hypothetical protein
MDVHVRLPVTTAVRRCGLDVLTAQQAAAERLPDPELLDRATPLQRVLFSQDDDLLVGGVATSEAWDPVLQTDLCAPAEYHRPADHG